VNQRLLFAIQKFRALKENGELTSQTEKYLEFLEKLTTLWDEVSSLDDERAQTAISNAISSLPEDIKKEVVDVIAQFETLSNLSDPLFQALTGGGIGNYRHEYATYVDYGKYVAQAQIIEEVLSNLLGREILDQSTGNILLTHKEMVSYFWNNAFEQLNISKPEWFDFTFYRGDELDFWGNHHAMRETILANAGGNYFLAMMLQIENPQSVVQIFNHEVTHYMSGMKNAPRRKLDKQIINSAEKHNENITELISQMITRKSFDLPELDQENSLYQPGVNELIKILQEINEQEGDHLFGTRLLIKGLLDYNAGLTSSVLSHVEKYYTENLQKKDFSQRMDSYTDSVYKSNSTDNLIKVNLTDRLIFTNLDESWPAFRTLIQQIETLREISGTRKSANLILQAVDGQLINTERAIDQVRSHLVEVNKQLLQANQVFGEIPLSLTNFMFDIETVNGIGRGNIANMMHGIAVYDDLRKVIEDVDLIKFSLSEDQSLLTLDQFLKLTYRGENSEYNYYQIHYIIESILKKHNFGVEFSNGHFYLKNYESRDLLVRKIAERWLVNLKQQYRKQQAHSNAFNDQQKLVTLTEELSSKNTYTKEDLRKLISLTLNLQKSLAQDDSSSYGNIYIQTADHLAQNIARYLKVGPAPNKTNCYVHDFVDEKDSILLSRYKKRKKAYDTLI
jgi:hypothetical protein